MLTWYREVRRDLPWRRTNDPYAIWISEVMLQQTRVETVRGYYERFLGRFPTVEALAAAPIDEVLSQWSGLGYYARARSLHRAAAMIVEEHGGALPADPKALAALPGFGPYTVAAVGSIAFGLDLPAVDGNVARVFTRWTCREGDPRDAKALAHFRRLGQTLLPSGDAADWNQALMELGASLCSPGNPACLGCPAAFACRAHLAGRERELPPRRKAKERPILHLAAALIRRGDEILLARRPDSGLFASLWELPAVELAGDASPREQLARWLARASDAAIVAENPASEVVQTLTHRELALTVYDVELRRDAALRIAEPYVDARFVDPEGPLPGGLSSVTRKALSGSLR